MPKSGSTIVIVGGTGNLGLALAKSSAGLGCKVIITGRDAERAAQIANSLGPAATGLGVDLTRPESISGAFDAVDQVDHVVLAAYERGGNTVADFDTSAALRQTTVKLIGYTEVIHTLLPRITRQVESSVVLFGGTAKDQPRVGSATLSAVNAGLSGLTKALVVELSPVRVNTVHPGLVGDTPAWANNTAFLEQVAARTPSKRVTRTEDVVQSVLFLMDNLGVNGVELVVDGGSHINAVM